MSSGGGESVSRGSSRGTKRKADNASGSTSKKTRGELYTPSLPGNGYPREHPFNKDGYRYILAEADPHAPHKQEFDESSEMAGKPIPGFLCRALVSQSLLLSFQDRAQQINLSEDRLSLTGYKFYCTARSNHSVSRGAWFFETRITDLPEGAATRIGWAQKYANLQAPLGFDKFGYSVRSKKGTKFHESHGKTYSQGYTEGDVLGTLIELPEIRGRDYLSKSYKDKPLIKFKSHLYFEEKDRQAEALKNLKPLPGSKISFFKNGEPLGEAFSNIYVGDYFPAVSTFKCAKVKINFGPKFKFPPKSSGLKYRPMCQRSDEAVVEQALSNMRFFAEKDVKLRLDNYVTSP